MSQTFEIEFDNKEKLFFAGQTVTGIVKITSTKVKTVNSLKLEVKGFCKVKWEKYDVTYEEWVTRKAKEEYYLLDIDLWESDSKEEKSLDSKEEKTLDIGTTDFPFTFTLPNFLPSSFESSYGKVRHVCIVTLDMAKHMFDSQYTEPFSVGGAYDLNKIVFAKDPILMSNEKTLCCWCCKGGEISFTVNIDHAGYVPGETIIINAECSNKSNKVTRHTAAEVVQKIIYRAKDHKKIKEKVVCQLTHDTVEKGGDDIWSGEKLVLPPLPPSHLPQCSLIEISYSLRFSIVPRGLSMALDAEKELIIGSIPLKDFFPKAEPSADTDALLPNSIYPELTEKPTNPTEENVTPGQSYFFPVDKPMAYPWADLYPDLPAPTHGHGAEEDKSTDKDKDKACPDSDDENKSGNASSKAGFVPRYVSYGVKQ